MVYRKYVYKKGRKHGPYYYHSYRDGNSVRKIYIGREKEYKKWRKHQKKSGGTTSQSVLPKLRNVLVVFSVLVLLIIAGFFVYQGSITGRASLNIQDSYVAGENIVGSLRLSLKYGELLPINSKLVVEQDGVVDEIFLSDLILSNVNGNFYVEGVDVGGEGEGYGFIGEKITYPEVFFKLKIYDADEEPIDEEIEEEPEPEEEPEEDEEPIEEEPESEEEPEGEDEEIEEEPESEEEPIDEEIEEEPESEEEPEGEDEEVVVEPEEIEEDEEPIEEPEDEEGEETGESLITGEAVKEDKNYIEASCSKDNDFVYEIEEGKTAEIKKNSVEVEEIDEKGKVKKKKIGDDAVELEILDDQVVVSTDYSVTEQGFGEEYLTEETNYVDIDLEELGIRAQEGMLTISLVYDGVGLVEVSEEISIISEEIPETPEINITEPEINVTETNITIPETNVTDVTIVNETAVNTSALVTTKQYKAIINRPVKWIKTIKGKNLSEIAPLILELPKEAENITIKTGEEVQEALDGINEYEQVIDETDRQGFITGQVTGEISLEIRKSKGIVTRFWEWLTGLTITGNVIYEEEIEGDITETSNSKIIDLADIANQTQENEIGIEYYTDAPVSSEENISNGKRIIVSALSELGYTEILAYTQLDNRISMNDADKIKIYWIIEETSLNIEEKNANGGDISTYIDSENKTNSLVTGQVVGEINETDNTYEEVLEADVNESDEQEISIPVDLGEQSNINNITVNQTVKQPEQVKQLVNFTAYDLDADGFVDYVEWIVPHLSEQIYEIIYITKAEHLDENRTFISDIYEDVKEQDDNWSEPIPAEHYVRVGFEKPLDKTKDITIYARRKSNSSVVIDGKEVAYDVYEKKKRIDEIQGLLE